MVMLRYYHWGKLSGRVYGNSVLFLQLLVILNLFQNKVTKKKSRREKHYVSE